MDSKNYFRNLDSFRFYAALTVVFSHCVINFEYEFSSKYMQIIHKHLFMNGDLGVNFFFVLSGFLITWLLYNEKEKFGTINLIKFYVRRILRIWPVYYVVVIIGFFLSLNFTFNFIENTPFFCEADIHQLKWYIFFLANYSPGENSLLMSSLWSVAVEEQFYLLWPLIILIIQKKNFVKCCVLIIAVSFLARIHELNTTNSFITTPFVMSDLAFGGLISYLSSYSPPFKIKIENLRKSTISLIYCLLLVYIFLHGFSHIFGNFIYLIYAPFEPLIFAFFFGFIILEQNFSKNSFYKFGNFKLASKLGKLSYGIYAYHSFAIFIVFYISKQFSLQKNLLSDYLIKVLSVFMITWLLSFLSYHLIESKFLKLKEKFTVE